MSSAIWIVIFAAVMFGAGLLGVRWLTRRGAAELRREAEKLERIASEPINDAALKALALLSDGALLRSIESSYRGDDSLELLAPELRRILLRYETIEVNTGSHATVTRTAIAPSALQPGFLRIGSVAAGTDVEGEIVVRSGDETIYELYPNEPPDPTFGTYRSIYHWILAMAEEARGA